MLGPKFDVLFALFMVNFAAIEAVERSKDVTGPQCRDENDQPVDWFVMYKIPKIRESSEPMIRAGISYLYMTDKTVGTGWRRSEKDVTSKKSMPGNTLSSLYVDNASPRLMWLMYNDKPPNGHAIGNYGHAKGVVVTDGEIGFWLIHSVPGFPFLPRTGEDSHRRWRILNESVEPDTKNMNSQGEYGYPDTGRTNGQSFMCVTVKSDQIDAISRQLMYNQIIVYRKNLPESLAKVYPVFVDASNEVRIADYPYKKKATIRSHGGSEFTSFAKSDKWARELYDDFVGPELNSNLLVETWQNGRGKLSSECNGTQVLNVESVNLQVANVVFTSTRDHSKWAISSNDGKNGNWVCVGDINRADTQFTRGGGTVCLKSSSLWKSYKNSVNDVEPCPKKKTGVFTRLKNWVGSKFG